MASFSQVEELVLYMYISTSTIYEVLTCTNTYTLPETNIAPENGWLEYYFPIGEAYFQGLR